MTIQVEGLDSIRKKIESLGQPRALKVPMGQAVDHLQLKMKAYPIGNQHRPQPFRSEKSRRFFFWALREGKIEVPYRRGQSPGSEKLGTSWTTSVSADGRTGKVGNDASYGPLVQDRTRQTAYHKATGWNTVQDVVKKEQKAVLRFFQIQYERLLKK